MNVIVPAAKRIASQVLSNSDMKYMSNFCLIDQIPVQLLRSTSVIRKTIVRTVSNVAMPVAVYSLAAICHKTNKPELGSQLS